MASRKLTKKLYKCVRKASKGNKNQFYRGIKSVLKAIKKGETGFVLFAGDTEPVEIICHLPLVCEEVDVPYCYVPSKAALGAACGSRKHTCCVFITCGEQYKEVFDECKVGINKLPSPCL
jgi:ribosomal protein L7Ae-like RNA K-turn-binding protein